MSIKPMYRAKLNSPETNIIGSITDTDTQFSVVDISAVTPDENIFPILLMIGGNRADCETVLLTGISGNTLTVERGYRSVARAWEADNDSGSGEIIAANFGAQHHNDFVDNIEYLAENGGGGTGSSGIELSDNDTPTNGIKQHLRIMADVDDFTPFTPPDPDDPDPDNGDSGQAGGAGFALAVEILQAFAGAKLAELRIYDPDGKFNSVLPATILQGVKDLESGGTALTILTNHYAAIFGHIFNTDVHVTAEYINNLDQLLAELVAFTQKDDIFVTPTQVAAWNLMGQLAADAIALAQEGAGKLTDHEARIAQLEDAAFNQIHTNPFLVTFGNLAGVIMTRGIHNPVYRRIEC